MSVEPSPDLQAELITLIVRDDHVMRLLAVCRDALGPDAWLSAGKIRNTVWDSKFGGTRNLSLADDADVLVFDSENLTPEADRAAEAALTAIMPGVSWQVRNQARMHLRNGDRPYHDIHDAMSFWLETATSIAARLRNDGGIDVLSAHGLDDLMAGIVRATPRGEEKSAEFLERVRSKNWRDRWPGLRLSEDLMEAAS